MTAENEGFCILATSLVPGRDRELQAAAVASWRQAGFEVISVNGENEAGAVRAAFPGVAVIRAPRTGEQFARKPVPFIHDLLKSLRTACVGLKLEDCTVGVINADIFLRPLPDLIPTLRREAKGSLVLGPRIDVTDASAFAGYQPTGTETYSVGYDWFCMSGDLLSDFADSPFCMGMPFWDYWMPLVALLKGRPLKTVTSPTALHVHHETRWDDTIYLFFHALISYIIEMCRTSTRRDVSAEARQFDLLFDVLSYLYAGVFARGTEVPAGKSEPTAEGVTALADFYDRFQQVAVHHIKSRSTPISVAEGA